MSEMNPKVFFMSWGMLLIGVVMNVFGTAVIKSKMNLLGQIDFSSFAGFFGYFFSLARYPSAFFGIVAVLVAPVPLAVALSRMQVSVALPMATALNFLVLIPLSILYLGESFTLNKSIAIVLIVASIWLLYK
jgi:multidrug transporter EmrE-like cation transporter